MSNHFLLSLLTLFSFHLCINSEKFIMTKQYLLTRNWIYMDGRLPYQIVFRHNGFIYNADNRTKWMNGQMTWKFNDVDQWLQIISSDPKDIKVELNTLIANFNPQYYPQAKIVGYHWHQQGTFIFSLSQVIPGQSSLHKIDKNMITSNVWSIQIGTQGGLHSNLIFNPDGKLYQEDNKTIFRLQSSWSITNEQSLFLTFRYLETTTTCFITTVIANNNPAAKNDITLVGGQIPMPSKDSYVPHTCTLTLAKIQKFRITKKYLMSKNWYSHLGGENGTQIWMILHPNGKIYGHDNGSELYPQSKWSFNENQQWIHLQFTPETSTRSFCNLNAVIVNDNPTLFPDVTLMGDFINATQGQENVYALCNLALVQLQDQEKAHVSQE